MTEIEELGHCLCVVPVDLNKKQAGFCLSHPRTNCPRPDDRSARREPNTISRHPLFAASVGPMPRQITQAQNGKAVSSPLDRSIVFTPCWHFRASAVSPESLGLGAMAMAMEGKANVNSLYCES